MVLSLGLPLVDGGEMEAGKTNRQGRWRNDALDLYLRSFDIPYDDCYYPAFSRCVGIVAMCLLALSHLPLCRSSAGFTNGEAKQ